MKISSVRLKEIIKEEINDLFVKEKDIILESLSDNTLSLEEEELMREGLLDMLSSLINRQEDPTEKENLAAVQNALGQLSPSSLRDVQDAMEGGVTITGNRRAARKTPWDLMETE
jgi:uncharacterized phage-associated protein